MLSSQQQDNQKVAGILQPAYLPWLGFFEQMQRADVFIILDDVQHTKQDWRNRNRIRTQSKDGSTFLTVPVRKAPVDTLVNEVLISYDSKWIPRHLNLIRSNYAKAPYFEEHFANIKEILETRYEFLIDLDMKLIDYFAKAFDCETSIVFSSSLKTTGRKTEKLINLCKAVEATDLYDGWAAQDFIDSDDFLNAELGLHYQKYAPAEYPQQHAPFVPFLSALDLLLNCGPQSADVIQRGGQVVTAVPSPGARG